nr:gamma-glutamyl-gamma-aminobutyrate hydrolase family protein [Ruminococcus champanellensis]
MRFPLPYAAASTTTGISWRNGCSGLPLRRSDKPILGICRGIQLFNVLLGGTLYQDLDSEHPSSVEHHMLPPYNRTVHRVTLEPGILSSLIREWEFGVNSYHHQAICRLAPVLHTEAVSQDGLIEGVSCPDMRFLLAVQWHPELIYREDPRNFAIVKAFADAVRGI